METKYSVLGERLSIFPVLREYEYEQNSIAFTTFFFFYRGLVEDKPDESLFFEDKAQPSDEVKGIVSYSMCVLLYIVNNVCDVFQNWGSCSTL